MSLFHLFWDVHRQSILASLIVFSCWGSGAAESLRFDLASTEGRSHTEIELPQAPATVFVFLSTDCPISNRYAPLLHKLESAFGSKGVSFFAVFSDGAVSTEAARKHLHEYGLEMAGLMDPAASLAKQLGARVTPEVAVVSRDGKTLYRGRIDNRYVDWGKTRAAATENDLEDALDRILAGKPVTRPVTKALGCAIADVN